MTYDVNNRQQDLVTQLAVSLRYLTQPTSHRLKSVMSVGYLLKQGD